MEQSGSSTTTHWVSNVTEWPPQTQAITRMLSQETLGDLKIENIPFVSPRCLPLLQEIQKALQTEEDVELVKSEPILETRLLDVLNIVLNTVADIREVLNLDGYGDCHSSITFWSPFLSLLGRLCCEDASVLRDVKYILPYSDVEVGRIEPRLDGTAHLFVSYITTEPRQAPTPKAPDSAASSSSAEEEGTCEEDFDAIYDDTSFYTTSSQITTSDTSTLAINLPFSAHLLPGNGKRVNAVLPVISVADPSEVVLVLSSVLYQRYVWGIKTPAVAIAISKYEVSANVVIGWIDHNLPIEGSGLPTINIARPTDTLTRDPLIGAFDLTNTLSAVKLASFILNLESHFADIIKEASNPHVRHLSWRSDRIDVDDFSGKKSSEQLGFSISQWVAQTHLFANTREGPGFSRTPSPQPELQNLQIPGSTTENLSPVTEEEHEKLPSKIPRPKLTKVKAAKQPISTSKKSAAKEAHTASSSWAAKSLSTGTESSTGSTATWLADRLCIRVTNTSHDHLSEDTPGDKEETDLINRMVGVYNRATEFCWPEEWGTLDDLPPVDSIYHQQRETLFSHYNQLHQDPDKKPPGLAKDEVQLISQRFSTIFSASSGAFTLQEAAKNCGVREAESRHDWDALLYHFYTIPNQALSTNVLLERTINYSRNPSADINETENLFKNRLALAYETEDVCERPSRTPALRHIRELIHNAATEAVRARKALQGTKPADTQLALTARSKREPPAGIVDAILVAPIENTTGKDLPPTHLLVKCSPPSPKGESQVHLSAGTVGGETVTVRQTDLLSGPFQTSCTEMTKPPTYFKSPVCTHHEDDMRLPIMLVEYKKPDDLPAKALNQCRMYCVSAVSYLATLKIKEHPVFGFATAGQVGFMIMAWHSAKRERIYLLERNTCSFDLSIPLQAFHFATCVVRLTKIGQTLQDKFRDIHSSGTGLFGLDTVTMEKLGSWTKAAQKDTPKNPMQG